MDMDDLVEHPLWHQLLELLFRKLALSRRHSQFRLKLLRVYLRLCSGLLNSPAQAVEAMCGVVVHWTQRLVAARSGPAIGSPLSQKDLRRMMQADPELNLFVMLLNCILRDSASVLEAPGFHKEGDVLVFLALYVIAHGTLIYSETEVLCWCNI